MRVGFFTDTYTPQTNGVVTSIRLFKKALEARGHDVRVFAPAPAMADDDPSTIRFRSMPLIFQREMRLASPISFEAMRAVEVADLDIVHAHDPFSIGLFGLRVARRRRIPYVHTYHTLYPEYVHYVWDTTLSTKLAERLSREYCDLCDAIIAPSTKIQRYLRRWGTTSPIDVIATGIDTARFKTAPEADVAALRTRFGFGADQRVLLSVGRLGREKSVDTLLRALSCSRHSDAAMLVVGDGPDRRELERIVRELRLGERVRFAGYLDGSDLVAAYHLADAFVFASTTETQGLVVGEALAAGLPVIAVQDPAVADFVVEGETGFLVPAHHEPLARAIDTVLDNDDLRAAMGEASADRAGHFSIEVQAERLEACYTRAIEHHRPRLALAGVRALPGAAVRGVLPVVRALPTRGARFARRAGAAYGGSRRIRRVRKITTKAK
jgi:glycosyltransferase involved in cell wall biosynthesis